MAKNRYINTKFWSDTYISNLDPVEKLLFLYLITNEHTNISGIYELPIKYMSIETGIEKEMIQKVLSRFTKDKKVLYAEGWVCVANFPKHQDLENENIKKGIENSLKEVPGSFIAYIIQKKIPYLYPMDSLGIEPELLEYESELESEPKLEYKLKPILADKSAGKEINDVLGLFKILNPNYEALYKNKTQRNALEEILKKWGRGKIENAIKFAAEANGKDYAPTITTPMQLRDKLGQLIAYYQRSNKNIISKI